MNIKKNLINGLKEKHLIPQNKKWLRMLDALAAIFCFLSAGIALYFLKIHPEGKLPYVSSVVVYTFLIASLPLSHLLYRASDLKKIERLMLVLFILASSMSLLLSVLSASIKT